MGEGEATYFAMSSLTTSMNPPYAAHMRPVNCSEPSSWPSILASRSTPFATKGPNDQAIDNRMQIYHMYGDGKRKKSTHIQNDPMMSAALVNQVHFCFVLLFPTLPLPLPLPHLSPLCPSLSLCLFFRDILTWLSKRSTSFLTPVEHTDTNAALKASCFCLSLANLISCSKSFRSFLRPPHKQTSVLHFFVCKCVYARMHALRRTCGTLDAFAHLRPPEVAWHACTQDNGKRDACIP